MEATTTKIGTLEELQAALEELGYECARADLDGDGKPEPLLTVVMTVDDKKHSTVISPEEGPEGGYFLIDCEFCQLKDLSDDDLPTDHPHPPVAVEVAQAQKMVAQLLRLLSLNHDIAPFAFAIVDDTLDGIDPNDPIVLVHRLPIGDLSAEEVDQAFAALRRGLNEAVASILG